MLYDAIQWWHTIDLGNGIITPGHVDQRTELAKLHLPDLTDKTVLDLGTWDGYYAFEVEKLGASRVLAVDTWAIGTGYAGFNYARSALKSRVEMMQADVMILLPGDLGRWDVVLFLGLLYHLRHPLLALERIVELVAPDGLLVLETYTCTPEQVDREHFDEIRPALVYLESDNSDPAEWKFFGPTPALVHHWLKMVGFTGETVHRDHRLVVHARRA